MVCRPLKFDPEALHDRQCLGLWNAWATVLLDHEKPVEHPGGPQANCGLPALLWRVTMLDLAPPHSVYFEAAANDETEVRIVPGRVVEQHNRGWRFAAQGESAS